MGMPIGLYPLAAAQVQPIVLSDGSGWYVYTLDGVQTMHAEEDVLHFRIFGNGRVGLSPLQYGALSMGIASASDQYAGQFFTRGGKPGGVLRIDRILTPKQRAEVREAFKEVHEGTDAAHKLFVLEAGMQYQQVQLAPEALQMIETRKFSVNDVARFWGVPAFLLNQSEGSTSWGTGLEQQMLGFYNLTIRPYTLRIAAGLRAKLVPVEQQRRKKIAYDFDELLAVDLRSKAEYYTKLASNGIMTRNEIRERLLLPQSVDKNADALTLQSAMVPLSKIGEKASAPLPKPEGTENVGTQEPDAGAE
jgi:HK97 family phage portal protein